MRRRYSQSALESIARRQEGLIEKILRRAAAAFNPLKARDLMRHTCAFKSIRA